MARKLSTAIILVLAVVAATLAINRTWRPGEEQANGDRSVSEIQQANALIGRSWSGAHSGVGELSGRVVRSAEEWTAFWQSLRSDAPPVSFDGKSVMAVALFTGTKRTGGFSVEITEVTESAEALAVEYKINVPSGIVTQALTTPYVIQIVPFREGKVTFGDRAGSGELTVEGQ